MATMNISLPDAMKQWAEAQARWGKYSNVSDYVRDLICRDRERTDAIARMQAAITVGIDSGVAEDFSMEALQAELDR
jgi:antitoxin ParD1/3/4